jgi:3-isopropylmalate/(R)-2-methylmalate dehydratase large subunit
VESWRALASDPGCHYDDVVVIDAADVPPTVTWGINPGQAIAIDELVPTVEGAPEHDKAGVAEALSHMKLTGGAPIKGTKVDVAFFGSCTNARITDFVEVARVMRGRKVHPGVQAIAVPGSHLVKLECEKLGIDTVLKEAGFEWRDAGCSMCLAMNPDKLVGDQLCASSSNRNFKGRQGSPTGRTVLMSPVMVAAAAVTGMVSDAREVFGTGKAVA